jgi:hypothetical protein
MPRPGPSPGGENRQAPQYRQPTACPAAPTTRSHPRQRAVPSGVNTATCQVVGQGGRALPVVAARGDYNHIWLRGFNVVPRDPPRGRASCAYHRIAPANQTISGIQCPGANGGSVHSNTAIPLASPMTRRTRSALDLCVEDQTIKRRGGRFAAWRAGRLTSRRRVLVFKYPSTAAPAWSARASWHLDKHGVTRRTAPDPAPRPSVLTLEIDRYADRLGQRDQPSCWRIYCHNLFVVETGLMVQRNDLHSEP